jgi:hypothetical protein
MLYNFKYLWILSFIYLKRKFIGILFLNLELLRKVHLQLQNNDFVKLKDSINKLIVIRKIKYCITSKCQDYLETKFLAIKRV